MKPISTTRSVLCEELLGIIDIIFSNFFKSVLFEKIYQLYIDLSITALNFLLYETIRYQLHIFYTSLICILWI